MLETITIREGEVGERSLTVVEFLGLPLRERARLILGERLVFRTRGEVIDPRIALESLRHEWVPARRGLARKRARGQTRADADLG
jgi:hypothetical protein